MVEISAALVKELRERTGAGMMDCKKALSENGGDIQEAMDWLRKKGLSKAEKKAGRAASEGLVAFSTAVSGEGMTGALIELNSETDFVARNDQFQSLAREASGLALAARGDVEAALSARAGDGVLRDAITHLVATIGENMALRRAAFLEAKPGVVAAYMHSAIGDGLGRLGVMVALESTGDKASLLEIGRQIAMQVAAGSPAIPQSVRVEELDPALVAREREILSEQASGSGKPAAVIEKMVEGRLRKYYEEVVLLKQPFIRDPDKTVEAALKDYETRAGAPIKVLGFVRFALGEGVEKKVDDFAAEVAALTGQGQ